MSLRKRAHRGTPGGTPYAASPLGGTAKRPRLGAPTQPLEASLAPPHPPQVTPSELWGADAADRPGMHAQTCDWVCDTSAQPS